MAERYDAIVVGGGHNGLTCAGYLARAGQRVILLERRHVTGGLAAEFEFLPGYRASMPNSPGSLEPKVVRDLELERHGLSFTRPDPSLVMPFPDGRAMVAWRDPERTREEIAKFSKKDAAGYDALFEFLNAFARRIGVSLFAPPPSMREIASRLETPEDEEAFALVFMGSLRDLLGRYLESEEMKCAIAAISVTSNLVGPSVPGTPLLLMMRPLSLASSSIDAAHDPRRQYLRGSTGLPRGGMGGVARAMERAFRAAGGAVRTGCEVARILTRDGRAEGVALASGAEILAPVVASNLHPVTTLLRLLDAGALDAAYRARLEALPRRGSAFKIMLALDGLPRFAAAPAGLEAAYAGCQFRIGPSLDYMEQAFDDAKHGRPSAAPIILGLTPTMGDPGMAPPGKHVMSLNVWHAPTCLRDGDWATEREQFGQRCIDLLAGYIPNLKDIIGGHRFLSPADLEAEFGLLDANIMHLDMMPARMFGLRPLAGWADYATPVAGLYLCGSGAWPGGTVSGLPGHNASQRILDQARC